ncbi:MAG: cytochrome c6 [Acidobacteriaceae bacterium]|jgi:mono/diheme cytochrome c family protein|nr:cytochrome c6 [Acidobacteriaceae bacterium]
MNGNRLQIFFSTLLVAAFVVATAPTIRADDAGEKLYASKCAACHGPDGKGQTAMGKSNKLRDLASPDVQKLSEEELSAIISNGKNKMPAYGKSLKPDQIKELVAYLRTLGKKA